MKDGLTHYGWADDARLKHARSAPCGATITTSVENMKELQASTHEAKNVTCPDCQKQIAHVARQWNRLRRLYSKLGWWS